MTSSGSPFWPGTNVSNAEALLIYSLGRRADRHCGRLVSLRDIFLVCAQRTSRAIDISDASSKETSRKKTPSLISAALLAPVLAMRPHFRDTIPKQLAFPQLCLQNAFVRVFSPKRVAEVVFTLVENLVNAPPFTDFREWLNSESYGVEGLKTPISVLAFRED